MKMEGFLKKSLKMKYRKSAGPEGPLKNPSIFNIDLPTALRFNKTNIF